MKKVFMLMTVAAMVVIGFTSCNPTEETNTTLLTQSKGWVLSAATSSPSYLLSDGSYATDLMVDGYLSSAELDEIIYFNANGSEVINPGSLIDPTFGYQTEVAATWSFNSDETVLNMQLPFFYDNTNFTYDSDIEACTILSLTANQLRIKYTFNVTDPAPAKEQYSFTITYVPAK